MNRKYSGKKMKLESFWCKTDFGLKMKPYKMVQIKQNTILKTKNIKNIKMYCTEQVKNIYRVADH